MKQSKYTVEQIINNLRKIEVMVAQGKTIQECCREPGFAEQSYYRWRSRRHADKRCQAPESTRTGKRMLKKLVADLSVDNAILKEAVEGKF